MTARKGIGTLSDVEIKILCEQRQLISDNYVETNVRQACYELRASNIYYDLAEGKKKYVLKAEEFILLKPKHLIVVITYESLNLPSDTLGRILTKGKLFSVGILPINTYADPGFKGNLGIVLYNLSNNYLKIQAGDAIAKIEFSQLSRAVAEPYHGQHGYGTKIWPISEDMVLSDEEAYKDSRVGSVSEEITLSYGNNVGKVIERVFRFERYLILAACTYLLLSLLLIAILKGTDWLSPLIAIILGIIANISTTLLVYFATNLRKK